MKDLIRDTRVQRLLLANVTGSIGSGITIVAIPWLLVHRSCGDQIYGYATIGTTIALFLFMPHYGAWIDGHSHKKMLLAGELFGLAATLIIAAIAFLSSRVATWQLIVSFDFAFDGYRGSPQSHPCVRGSLAVMLSAILGAIATRSSVAPAGG